MCRRLFKAWHQEVDIAKKSEALSEEVCDAMPGLLYSCVGVK